MVEVTVTTTETSPLMPFVPEQVRPYVVLVEVGLTICVPEMALLPANVPPVPLHDVELVDDHVSVEDPPGAIDVGEANRVAVGV